MKKFLKITGIVLVVLFALILILPFAFQGKITEIVKKEANSMLNAKIDFGKVNLSFIRNFPNAAVIINDFYIVGVDEFENDTLASFDRLAVSVNIKSFLGDNWEINRIKVTNPRVLAKVLSDGKVNWDVMKDSGEDEEEETTEDSGSSFNMKLKDITIENGYIVYDDQEGKMKAVIDNINFSLSGDMAGDVTTLKALADIEKLSFLMDGVPYLRDATLNGKMDIEADLKNDKYTFSDNEFKLNNIKMNFEGWLALLEEGMDMDIKLNTPNIAFKDLLSMVPALYAKDFEKIQTRGELNFDAAIHGTYKDSTSYPAFDVKLNIMNAYFKYPDLPKSIDNININMSATHKQGDLDLIVVDVPKFHFEMGGNPFDVHAKIATPMSDMQFAFGAKGTLNMNMIKEVYPLEDGMDISGILKADLEAAGRMSYIEKEQYESISAKGDLSLSQFTYKSEDMMPILINEVTMNFTPKYVNLTKFDMKMGNNDVQANGRLENFIAYALKDETIKGELNVSSTLLNVNDFMGEEEAAASTENTVGTTTGTTTEEPMSIIEVPKNINFRMNANLKKVVYDKIILENIKGNIRVVDGVLHIDNASMNAFGGNMDASGFYSTANIADPNVDMKLDIKNVLYTEVYNQTDMIKEFAPIFENMTGKFSANFKFSSKLGQDMSILYPSVMGKGVLTSKDLSVSNLKVLDALADATKNDKLRKIDAKDVKISFTIENGRINTEPFDIKMGTTKMNISGSTGLDQTIDYTGKLEMPELQQQVQQIKQLQNVNVTASLKIGGTFSKPTVKVDISDLAGSVKDAAIQEVKSVVNENLDKLINEAKKQKESLVAAAQKQATSIRSEAAKAGNSLISEAEKQGQKLIDEANKTSNPLAKAAAVKAAEASAKKLKEEAQKQADSLNKNADTQATKLVNTATEQGDKLIQTAEKGKM